jgi:two-component system, OmpR family, alkaline phosphatase synthesis response regulator PhoP
MEKLVLAVEDDIDFRNALADKLRLFCSVSAAGDGEEAIEKILDERPCLILLDLLLPKLDGFKVLERLRKYPDKEIAATPVIVLSNLWSDKDILLAKSLVVESYFVKSNTSMNEVLARVQEILKKIDKKKLV